VWAEESGKIDSGKFEWSFGNGASGSAHANSGYTMMATGRVLRMGLSAYRNVSASGAAKVNIEVNRIEQTSYGVIKPSRQYSGTITFAIPLELAKGDRVNFRSATTIQSVVCAVVSSAS